jgi:ABC-2 type transport system ATP-binding protein
VIEVVDLKRKYGAVLAVDGVSFSVDQGEVVGFLGPNGAGKSTTLRVLTGFLAPTSGRAIVAGHDVVTEPLEARRAMGYMPETCPLYPELRVAEFLRFRAEVKGVPRRRTSSAVDRAMQQAGIHTRRGALIGQLSRGLRQRVGLADALVSDPPLLILDEPTAGLDPNQIREVRELVKRLKERHTVLLSTHILTEVEVTCDRAIVLSRGRVVASGTIDELQRQKANDRAEITIETSNTVKNGEDLGRILGAGATIERCVPRDRWLVARVVLSTPKAGVAPLVERLVGEGVRVQEAALQHTSLEEVFARLTRDEDRPNG